MKKLISILLALLLPIAAWAWTLPVPSGLTAGERITASDGSTLANSGAVVVKCTAISPVDNNAAMVTTLANRSCLLVTTPIDNSVDTLKLTATGAVTGQYLVIVNVSATDTVGFALPDESSVLQGAATTFGLLDAATFLFDGTEWIQTEVSDN
jgi:hypothetical protein